MLKYKINKPNLDTIIDGYLINEICRLSNYKKGIGKRMYNDTNLMTIEV